MSAPPNLVDLLNGRYVPVQESILSALDIGSIVALRKTSRDLYHLQTLKYRLHNVNHMLKLYFDDPLDFRSFQYKNDILLGGDDVLAFMYGEENVPRTLELHVSDVPRDRRPAVARYVHNAGYTRSPDLDYCCEGYSTWYKGSSTVLMWPECDDATLSLLTYKKPASDFNFLTWNKAFSIFPYHTFIRNAPVVSKMLENTKVIPPNHWVWLPDEDDWVVKEGYDAEPAISVGRDEDLERARRIGDTRTWVMNLDTTGFDAGPENDWLENIPLFPIMRIPNEDLPSRSSNYLYSSTHCFFDLEKMLVPPAVLSAFYVQEPGSQSISCMKKMNDLQKVFDEHFDKALKALPEEEVARQPILGRYFRGEVSISEVAPPFEPPKDFPNFDHAIFPRLREIADELIVEYDNWLQNQRTNSIMKKLGSAQESGHKWYCHIHGWIPSPIMRG